MRAAAPAVVLVVLDGWGLAPASEGNAVERADTPVMDDLWARLPHATLRTSGRDVGLPDGQMGNSEVGHLNLGAGAIVKQDLLRIDEDLLEADAPNDVLDAALRDAPRVHLIGLVSDGGVHSSLEQLEALCRRAVAAGVPDVVVHAFTDGRDTSPHGARDYLARVEGWDGVRVGTVVGRFYAMDRDSRAERTARAVALLREGRGDHHAATAVEAVEASYERDVTDEFVEPTTVGEDEATIRPGDSVLCFNFRPDRMRQLVAALGDDLDRVATMTRYTEGQREPVAFAPQRPTVTLAHVVAGAGRAQLHVAETEKYPHVTYFFNGGEEQEVAGERRELVPSPRDVATYDLKPQMSAQAAADAFTGAWGEQDFAFGVINFANADMVGHTGSIPAAIEAVQTVDRCLGHVIQAVAARDGVLLITADHGNADEMLEDDGSPDTAHSLNPVPFVCTDPGVTLRDEGILADVAPTVLDLLGLDQPPEMTGTSMIQR